MDTISSLDRLQHRFKILFDDFSGIRIRDADIGIIEPLTVEILRLEHPEQVRLLLKQVPGKQMG